MAWLPIALTVPQYEDINGLPFSLAVLKAFAAGTTTNIPMATDNTGTTTVTSIGLNASGYPEVSANVIIPHIEQSFKLVLYPTQAAADADTGAIWSVDNLTAVSGAKLGHAINSQTVTYSQVSNDNGKVILFTGAGGITFDLLAAATVGVGFINIVENDTSSTVTIDPNLAELINGAATLVLQDGESAIVDSTATAWRAYIFSTVRTSTANTFNADQTIQSSDAGAGAGPNLNLDRNSASPAAADVLSAIPFKGRDSGAGTDTYAQIQGEIVDPTATSEDGRLAIQSAVAGTLASKIYVGNGLYTAGGSDQGADTIQGFSGVFDGAFRSDGVALTSGTNSAIATLDVVMTSHTDFPTKLLIIEHIIPVTTATDLHLLLSTDGGVSYDSGASNYVYVKDGADSAGIALITSSTADTKIILTNGSMSNSAQQGGSFEIWFHNTNVTSERPRIRWSGCYVNNGANWIEFNGSGQRVTAQDTDAFRLLFSSGNISSVRWALKGFR